MSLGRISWLVVTATCAIAAAGTFIAGYAGYGVTICAVGLAAAVNLLPRRSGHEPGN